MINTIPILREERKLFISRVPKETKELFVKIAKDYFEEDYGMLLKTLIDNYNESQQMKILFFENINMKLDYLISKIDKEETPKEQSNKEIKLLGGKKILIEKKEVQNG